MKFSHRLGATYVKRTNQMEQYNALADLWFVVWIASPIQHGDHKIVQFFLLWVLYHTRFDSLNFSNRKHRDNLSSTCNCVSTLPLEPLCPVLSIVFSVFVVVISKQFKENGLLSLQLCGHPLQLFQYSYGSLRVGWISSKTLEIELDKTLLATQPTIVSINFPLLYIWIVGMLTTFTSAASSGKSSVQTSTTWTRPANCLIMSLTTGTDKRHGPHHGAVKKTKISSSFFWRTCLEKSSIVARTLPPVLATAMWQAKLILRNFGM